MHSDCLDCTLPGFLRGEKPRKKYSPPVYVTVHRCSLQPSGRTTRSTQDPLLADDELTNDRMNTEEIAEDSMSTSFPSTGDTSTPSFFSSSLSPTISSLTSSQDHTVSNISLPSNHSQTTQTPSLDLTPVPTNLNFSNNGNVISSSPICIHNRSLCHSIHNESMAHINTENIETAELQRDLPTSTYSTDMKENISMTTTAPSSTDEPRTMRNNTTDFRRPAEISIYQSTIGVNDTDDISNKNTSEQSHNNARRHARIGNQFFPYEQVYTLTYWMFYPYNKGKEVCTVNLGLFLGHIFKPRVKGLCHGEEITMGNHVGDWEHVSIQFKVSKGNILFDHCRTFNSR